MSKDYIPNKIVKAKVLDVSQVRFVLIIDDARCLRPCKLSKRGGPRAGVFSF